MPRWRKRTQEEYDREVEEATKRMGKYPEHLKSARTSSTWTDFLINIGVNPQAVDSKQGGDFWNKVREEINPRQVTRRSIYQEARQAGMPATLARRIRDWSDERATEAIENWQARY